MIQNHSRSGKRFAFTLVELMVVILIIAILVSLLSAGVIKAMGKIPEVTTRTEITQLETALRAFMSAYNLTEPPPSFLILREDMSYPAHFADPGTGPIELRSYQFLQKAFGKNLTPPIDWNGDNAADGPWTLQGHQCLVFYLGGIPNTAGVASGMPPSPQGFATNNMNPAIPAAVSPKRNGPYHNFIISRLVPTPGTGFFFYQDPWQSKISNNGVGPMPFVYFSSYGINNSYAIADCSSVAYTDPLGAHFAMPYWTGTTGTMLTYSNSNTYQISSAGRDGKFGYNPAFPQPCNLWSPTAGAGGTGADDQSNISSTLLGSGQN